MKEEKLLAILRLQKSKAIGDVLAKKLILNVGDVTQIFKEKPTSLGKINGIGSFTIQSLLSKEALKKAAKELDLIQKNNIKYTYFLDDDYPKNLQHCIDSPILFFKEGNFNLDNKKIISVVGTRNMTTYGKLFCEQFIEELAFYNPVIVSGFAYGVDICAHKTALKHKLDTLAVLAHGLGQIYPKIHQKYVHQVLERGGFITDFWYRENPLREHFLKRNRIIAGISDALIIIESAEKGGALVTAEIANSYNRDVFALPGKVTDTYSKGCNNLIKYHKAHLLTNVSDLVKQLNWDLQKKPKAIQKQLFVSLTKEEQQVFDYLQKYNTALLDQISKYCSIPIFKLPSILLQLELKGVVNSLPGKQFTLA